MAVLASVKVRNLKANHNSLSSAALLAFAVLASVKVRNLKANHNVHDLFGDTAGAVLASVKVRNLNANHNRDLFTTAHLVAIAIGCCSAYGQKLRTSVRKVWTTYVALISTYVDIWIYVPGL